MATQIVPQQQESISTSPQNLLEMAVSHGAGIDVIERLAKLQSDMLDRQAEEDFNEAMNRCQAKMTRIAANMENPQTRSRYADYAQIDRAIRPIYTAEGFALSFGEADCPLAEHLRLVCYVTRGRHTRRYQKDFPIVTKGPKGNDVMTPTHAHGSADAYAKRYLLKDIFNIAVGQDDDDGNGGMSMDEGAELIGAILQAESMDALKAALREAKRAALEARDYKAMKLIDEAWDRRRGELNA